MVRLGFVVVVGGGGGNDPYFTSIEKSLKEALYSQKLIQIGIGRTHQYKLGPRYAKETSCG